MLHFMGFGEGNICMCRVEEIGLVLQGLINLKRIAVRIFQPHSDSQHLDWLMTCLSAKF